MNSTVNHRLLAEIHTGAAAYVRNLAAAETAIYQGQFNVAKILRAVGHAQRSLALNAARLLQPNIAATQMFETILGELAGEGDGAGQGALLAGQPAFEVEEEAVQRFLARAALVRERARAVLQKGIASLAEHPDVLERDVHLFVWGCCDCGNLVEGERPSLCDICSAPAAEFHGFGPYYMDTPEHLGRLLPAEIIASLAETPALVAEAVAGIDETVLEVRPTADEWSAKENFAHLIETDHLFLGLAPNILSSPDPMPGYRFPTVPWKTHEGKGYERMPKAELQARFEESRAQVIAVFRELSWDEWSRIAVRPGRIASMLDMGRWLANHDLGHLVHIRRLAGKETIPAP